MKLEQRTPAVEEKKTLIQKIESLKPHNLFLYMAVLGSSLVFVFTLIAFNLSYDPELVLEFPPAFIVAAIFLIIANISVRQTVRHHIKENMHKVVVYSGLGLMMGISFLLSLIVAWEQLYYQDISISGSAFGSYLYLVSGLHVLHFLGGMVFLSIVFLTYIKASVDPVKTLIMVTNPYHVVKLKMLVTCWNFLDIVWLAILINFIILL